MNRASQVRAAIVGLGRWGQNLVEANARAQQGRLVFTHAATRSPQKAASFCAAHGLTLKPDLEALLQNETIDAVVLATPHSQHAAQVLAIASAGRHVFVEKPLALEPSEAQAAVAACKAAAIQLSVGFNRRFLPAFGALCSCIAEGGIGRPLHVEGSFCGPFGYGYSADMWRGDRTENPAGGMAAMGIHILDAMIATMGPVRRVSVLSRSLAVTSGLDDTTTVHLEFVSGATGLVSTLMATAGFWRLHVFGSEGWAQMPDQSRLITATLYEPVRERSFPDFDTLATELDCFAGSVLGQNAYPVTWGQALEGVATMAAIEQSARGQGVWVSVHEGDQ